MSSAGRVACVTGAAGSMGRAVVDALAGEGASIFAIDVDGDSLTEVIRSNRAAGREVYGGVCDVGDPPGVEEAFTFAVERLGRLDLLVNVVPSGASKRLAELGEHEWSETLRTDLGGIFLTLRSGFAGLRQSDRAAVVNVIDDSGVVADPSVVATPRAAAVFLTRALAAELAESSIGVYGVLTSPQVEDSCVARQIVAIAHGALTWPSGTVLRTDGGGVWRAFEGR